MEKNTTFGAVECGDCNTCGKCFNKEQEGTLYTMLIYSENQAGILNQITAVFTRRQVNIESLNVCASSTPGVHKYTITCFCDEEMAKMLTKQMEKKIDVLQARYYTSDQIHTIEVSLLKLSTPVMLNDARVSNIVRELGARIVEVNPIFAIAEKKGDTEQILQLYQRLNAVGAVLQFVRSGHIAVTKSKEEPLDKYLQSRKNER